MIRNLSGMLATGLILALLGFAAWTTNSPWVLLGIIPIHWYLPKYPWDTDADRSTNLAGGFAILASTTLIGFTIWVTFDLDCLWAIFAVIWITEAFPWDQDHKASITIAGVFGTIGGIGLLMFAMWFTRDANALWGIIPVAFFIGDHPWPATRKVRERYRTKIKITLSNIGRRNRPAEPQ